MREIMVKYVLDDEHERKLKEIASEYKKRVVKDACDDKSKPFGIIWKKAGKNGEQSRGTVAVIDIDYFYKLLTKK